MVEEAEFHRVTAWGKTAEACEKFLAKGRQVYVEGRLKTTTYEDKRDGIKRYQTGIVAEHVQFLGGRGEGGGGRSGTGRAAGSSRGTRDDGPPPYDAGDYIPPGIPEDDDIPFSKIDERLH